MPKRTFFLDATSLRTTPCSRKYHYTAMRGFRHPERKLAIEYGVAFHKFLASWRASGYTSAELGLREAAEHYAAPDLLVQQQADYRTLDHLFATIKQYVEFYTSNDSFIPFRNDQGHALVEQRFTWPAYEDSELRILCCGTIDAIGTYCGSLCISDCKTTSMWDTKEYLAGFRLSQQMMFYRHSLNVLAGRYPTNLGGLKNLPCFIDGVFLKKPAKTDRGNKESCKLERSDLIDFEPDVMEEFEHGLGKFIQDLAVQIKNNDFKPDGLINGACEGKYGKCEFFEVCSASKGNREYMLENMFKVVEYNPLTFGGRELQPETIL